MRKLIQRIKDRKKIKETAEQSVQQTAELYLATYKEMTEELCRQLRRINGLADDEVEQAQKAMMETSSYYYTLLQAIRRSVPEGQIQRFRKLV
jgi:DNA-binding ferritin-like protein